jgi:hypothetical protein
MSEQESDLRILGVRGLSAESVTIWGLTVPARFVTTLYRQDLPYSVDLEVRVDPEHGPVAEGLRVNAHPTEGYTYKDAVALLKDQPVDKLLHQALADSRLSATWDAIHSQVGKQPGEELTDKERAQLAASMEKAAAQASGIPAPVRRRLVTPDLLKEVAQAYRDAVAASVPPTKAIAERYLTTHSTAARWVREARIAGILGPSRGPVAGEDPAPSEPT